MIEETHPTPRPARRQKIQWPVKALVHFPGQRAARVIEGTQVIREASRYIFIVPDMRRPYIQKTIIVYDCPGLVIELEQMATQQPQQAYIPQPAVQQTGHLRLESEPQAPPVLRSRISANGPPASEAIDENGHRVVVPAAFGMAIG